MPHLPHGAVSSVVIVLSLCVFMLENPCKMARTEGKESGINGKGKEKTEMLKKKTGKSMP